jgi:phosphonoacetate hydrolase
VTEITDALDVLLDPALDPIVELVATRAGDDTYEVHAHDGWSRFRRHDDGHGWRFTLEAGAGRNPLGDQATDRFAPLAEELAVRYPDRSQNAYPHAHEQLAQVFDHRHAPDLVVLHTAAHNWEDQGGHRGEHGSIGAVQARAPFIVAGRGVRQQGFVARSAQLIDVAPTVLALMGAPQGEGISCNGGTRPDAHLGRQDGDVIDGLFDPSERPDHVIGFLLDGTNPNVLHDMIRNGEAPNIARLVAMGTAFEHGIVSSLPTVTLANHTSVMTGVHPGHHGILHNAWWDRERREQVITNSPENWATSTKWLTTGTETIHDAIHRWQPKAFTASVNEPCDRGADFSTFDLMRRKVKMGFPRTPDGLPHASERFVRPFKDYGWYTQVDHHGMEQALGLLSGGYAGSDYPVPDYLWVNFTLTDSAFHEGGPHSEIARASVRDTDARIGRSSTRRSGPASSTVPPSISWPITAWRRTIPGYGGTGAWRCATRVWPTVTRRTDSCTSTPDRRTPRVCP